MKLKAYAAMAAAATLALTACTAEDPAVNANGDGNVTFIVSTPGQPGTRALGDIFGDGGHATSLDYYVYEVVGEGDAKTLNYITTGNKPISLSTTVSLNLVTGKTYGIVWLAQAAGTYAYNPETQEMTVTYNTEETPLYQNVETRDAFCRYTELKVEGPTSQPVELYRPFAQVNFGTSDMSPDAEKDALSLAILEKAFGGTGLPDLKTQLVTVDVPDTYNIVSGKTTGEASVTFSATKVPVNQEFPYQPAKYEYLAMDYILAPADGTTLDLDFSVLNGADEFNKLTITSTPVKANYRTNIFGQLLTSTVDFNVEIKPMFVNAANDVPEHEIEVNLNKFINDLLDAEEGDEVTPTGDLDLSDLSGFMAQVGNTPSLKKTRAGLVIHIDELGVLHFAKNLTLNIPAGITVKTKRHDPTANIIVDEGATLTVKGNGTFDADNRIIDVNGKLIVDGNLTFKTSTTNRGAALQTNPTGEIVFNNGNMYVNCIGIWNDGKTTVNDGYFLSYSSSAAGRGGWSYFFNNNYGCEETGDLTINGGEFRGIQGVVSMCSGKITINDGFFMTTNAHGVGTPFYAVYATNNVVVTINGGYFWGASKFGPAAVEGNSAIVSGDNDTEKPDGKLIITGGYMNGKPYNHVGPALVPAAEGYDYQACDVEKNGVKFTWQVVPVGAE